MMWGGIDQQLSSVADKPGVSEYQQNTRMTVAGELQRRPGMAPANFSPTGSAAIGMVGAFPTSGPYGVTVDTAGSISGFPITGPIWEPPKLKPPIAQGGAWTINNAGFSGGYGPGAIRIDEAYDPVFGPGFGNTCTCPGTIILNIGTGDPNLCVKVTRGSTYLLEEQVVYSKVGVTAGVIFIPIPWSNVYPWIRVNNYSIGAITFVSGSNNGDSTPGCG